MAAFFLTRASPINTLNIIDHQNLFAVNYDDPASSALNLLSLFLIHQSSIAIVDPEGKFVREISPFMLNCCDEAVAPALATLSAGDLMAYIDCGGPPEDLVQIMKERLKEQNLGAALELLGNEGDFHLGHRFVQVHQTMMHLPKRIGSLEGTRRG
ncbi:hypothetical protein HN51_000959 [Arachis hypogaea]|nr:CBS domain-containing protein [Arachis hypogaea]